MFLYIPSRKQYRQLSDVGSAKITPHPENPKENVVMIMWRVGETRQESFSGEDMRVICAALTAHSVKLEPAEKQPVHLEEATQH